MVDTAKKTAGVVGGTGLGYLIISNPEPFIQGLISTANSQIAQAGFFFAVAAWIHSGRVNKEISKNFSSITEAINNVANALRMDLKKHGERLDNLSDRVQTLENKED
jgi:hypothetical protein